MIFIKFLFKMNNFITVVVKKVQISQKTSRTKSTNQIKNSVSLDIKKIIKI